MGVSRMYYMCSSDVVCQWGIGLWESLNFCCFSVVSGKKS